MVWVYDDAKGLWVRRAVFTPEAEWALTGVEEYHLPSTYYNVTPTYNCAILRPRDDVLRFERARWGIEGGPGMGHNAKVENLHKSPLWRPLVGKQHGAIVADGFYEWDTSAGRRQPYYIHRADGEPMLLAALYQNAPADGRAQPGGGVDDRVRATVVTCPANEAVGALHNRMPVILEARDVHAWLEDRDAGMLQPAPSGVLAMHPVSTDVNKSTNNRPDLLDAVDVPGGKQARLF